MCMKKTKVILCGALGLSVAWLAGGVFVFQQVILQLEKHGIDYEEVLLERTKK